MGPVAGRGCQVSSPRQHTPGPWTVDNQYIHGPDGIRFLAVAGDGAGQANARLIASAPDLYAALENQVNCWDAMLEHAERLDDSGMAYSCRNAIHHARAAIAKETATQ